MPAAVTETHISVLFFVGELVYKLRKPVRTGFVDFSTRAAREADCRREVELNRRLAPDVYLGVANITDDDGHPCDHLVVMRRLPDDRRLATLLRQGGDLEPGLRQLAHLMATFHAGAGSGREVDEAATAEAVLGNWEDNFEQMKPFVGTVLDPVIARRVERLARAFIGGRQRLFDQRIATGQIRDGHGDLLAEDIFLLDDGPRVLDCIEFDDRLRYGDILADVAFLAMDLERLQAPTAAHYFLDCYREFSAETWPATLADHYIAYRAHVRCKVACLRHSQGDPTAAAQAAALLDLCEQHLCNGQVQLMLVGGLPGTGKSTLAEGIAERLRCMVMASDEVRKDLAHLDHRQPAAAGYREGLYRPALIDATYHDLLGRARIALELGEPVVLDASWTDSRHRAAAAQLATDTHSPLIQIRCQTPAPTAAERITARTVAGIDASDATPEIAAAMSAAADPWTQATSIDTCGPIERSLTAAIASISSQTTMHDDRPRPVESNQTETGPVRRACPPPSP